MSDRDLPPEQPDPDQPDPDQHRRPGGKLPYTPPVVIMSDKADPAFDITHPNCGFGRTPDHPMNS
jgi:hypothetical protein